MNIAIADDAIAADCSKHIDKLPSKLRKNASSSDSSGIRRQLSRIAHSPPSDIGFIGAKLAQAREQDLDVEQLKLMKKGAKKLKSNMDLRLKRRKLDMESLQLRARSDASFASSRDEASQIGFIVMLSGKRDNVCILHWSSSKRTRVARSAPGTELHAFCDAMDFSTAIKIALEIMLQKDARLLFISADSKSLFDAIAKRPHISEKRLLIDLATLRVARRRSEMTNIGFIRAKRSRAEPLAKDMSKPALDQMLDAALFTRPTVGGWWLDRWFAPIGLWRTFLFSNKAACGHFSLQ